MHPGAQNRPAALRGAVAARLRSFCAVHDPRWAVGAFDFSAGIVDHAFDEPVTSLLMRSDAAMCHQKGARRTRSP